MTTKIARGSSGRGKAKSLSRGSSRKKAQPQVLDALPMPAELVRKISLWIFAACIVAVALAVAFAMRVPQMIGTAVGESIGEAGFAVQRVDIRGLDRMERLPVYAVALDQDSMAMPLVDLEETRARLLRFGWVKEARVSRRLPDTLVIHIVEREPSAIWQHNQELSLIDDEGVVLAPVELDAMPDLPLVIGPSANHHADELDALIGAAPELKPMMAGATWIGGRRWDLRFQSGEVLALPEGRESAQEALVKFARMDKMTQLLGRGFVRFDMRIPGKFIVRVSSKPGTSISDLAPPPPLPPAPVSSQPVDPAATI
jgi:cell division protein FtsQ